MITASAQKMPQDAIKNSDVTEQVVFHSEFDLIRFEDDGYTMNSDAFTSSLQYVLSSIKGGEVD
jgi:hypothetical protein